MALVKIGETIKTQRKERDLTQEELAGILGVSKAAISKWENAECYPDISRFYNKCWGQAMSLAPLS